MLKLFVSQKVRAAFPRKLKVTPIYVSAEGQQADWSWTSSVLTVFTFGEFFIWNTVDFKNQILSVKQIVSVEEIIWQNPKILKECVQGEAWR